MAHEVAMDRWPTMADYEAAARREGWEKKFSAFTRGGVSIAYVDWKVLCQHENIEVKVRS